MTTAVFGFVRKLFSVLREFQPEGVRGGLDRGDTWRHEEFAEYKATRDAMPDDMRSQIERIEQIMAAMNIPTVSVENYEADDVLGALAKQATQNGHEVLILTGDRDMFQLVAERIRILYTSGGPSPVTKPYGVAEVAERYGGLNPEQFLDMKALVGDSSDNIPGAVGVGEKTAIGFLTHVRLSGRAVCEHRRGTGAEEAAERARRRGRCAPQQEAETIVSDLDVAFDSEGFRLSGYDNATVRRIFEELEFRSLLRELEQLGEASPTRRGVGAAPVVGEEMQVQNALFPDLEPPATLQPDTGAVGVHPYLCIQTNPTWPSCWKAEQC